MTLYVVEKKFLERSPTVGYKWLPTSFHSVERSECEKYIAALKRTYVGRTYRIAEYQRVEPDFETKNAAFRAPTDLLGNPVKGWKIEFVGYRKEKE